MTVDTTYLVGCCRCATPVLVDMQHGPDARQRGVRMKSGTEHVILFCADCAAGHYDAAEWARILQNNLQCFEAAWAIHNTPYETRHQHRAEMADWVILGWASEITAEQARAA